ncbi:MAG TPA: hypothetical protein VIT85_02370 [Solirubrobacterales bacterium]
MAERNPNVPSLPEKVIAIHEALRVAKVPHAFGGALALAYYAEPRATIDIDLNVFLPVERWREAIAELEPLGVVVSKLNEAALLRDGQCRLWWERNPVDLFFSYDPIHDEMQRHIRRLPFADETLPFLSPEHLAVCKAMFNRPKDWLDIEQMVVASGAQLDLDEVETWLRRMVGPDDLRVQRISAYRAA